MNGLVGLVWPLLQPLLATRRSWISPSAVIVSLDPYLSWDEAGGLISGFVTELLSNAHLVQCQLKV